MNYAELLQSITSSALRDDPGVPRYCCELFIPCPYYHIVEYNAGHQPLRQNLQRQRNQDRYSEVISVLAVEVEQISSRTRLVTSYAFSSLRATGYSVLVVQISSSERRNLVVIMDLYFRRSATEDVQVGFRLWYLVFSGVLSIISLVLVIQCRTSRPSSHAPQLVGISAVRRDLIGQAFHVNSNFDYCHL